MVRLSKSKATATFNESLSLMGLIRYWLSFAVITSWYGAIMTVAGLLKVKQRKGGIFDRSQEPRSGLRDVRRSGSHGA